MEDNLKKLTPREKEILTLIFNGKKTKEIAKHLQISPHTVKNHLTNSFQKLKVHSRVQAVAHYIGKL